MFLCVSIITLLLNDLYYLVVQPFDRRCRVLPNDTVSCDRVLYQDPVEWKTHKEKLDEMIEEYRKMLEDLRVRD